MKNYITFSDAGSLRIGNHDFKILIPNGYGDGKTYVHLCEKDELPNSVKPHSFFTCFSGVDINIFEYDCGGVDVVERITGRFGVYCDNRHVYIVRWGV